MRQQAFSLALSAIVAAASAVEAHAAGMANECCGDLETRIAELEEMAARKGGRKVSLTISGLVSMPVMAWDDGRDRDVFNVSNDIKRPRIRFGGEAKINPSWTAGYVLEIGPNPNPFAPMDQTDFVSSGEHLEVRHSYWSLRNSDLGQVSVGLQSQATDLITESSVANTATITTPGLPHFLGYTKRGFFMRKSDGALSNLRFSDVIFRGRNASWGEGHRWNVVRYDSPVLSGFTVSASWGEDDLADMALRYGGQIGRFKIAAGIGAATWSDRAGERGCAIADRAPDVDCWETGGSLSVMDTETGLFLNAAAGYGKDTNLSHLYGDVSGITDSETFFYFVGGIERQLLPDWLGFGKTTLFGQVWHKNAGAGVALDGGRLNASGLGAGPFMSSADLTVWGASLVQSLGDGLDFYATINRTETDVRTSADGTPAGEVTTRIMPFSFIVAGMALRF